MPRIVNVPTVIGYVPPKGFKIVKIRKLADGSYEVTLEPLGFLSVASGMGAVAAAPVPAVIVTFILVMLSTVNE
jgi:hypothetical protein